MKKQDYSDLLLKLRSLGFPSSLERGLYRNVCLGKEAFQLRLISRKEGDILIFRLYLEKGEGAVYYPVWYEATLRKRPIIPATIIDTVDLMELDKSMSGVNWKIELINLEEMEADENISFEREEMVVHIMESLRLLEAHADGSAWADLLKWMHWIDTPMEPMTDHFNRYRSLYEVTQRYYFFEEEVPFSLQEAFRFLSHRWREKRLQDRNRTTLETNKESSGEVAKNRKFSKIQKK